MAHASNNNPSAPPRKKKVARETDTKQSPDKADQKTNGPEQQNPEEAPSEGRRAVLWIIVGTIMVLIIAAWIALYTSGNLTSSGEDSTMKKFGNHLTNIWNMVQEDIFQLKEDADSALEVETAAPEDPYEKVEQELFPQFNTNSTGTSNVNTNTNSPNTNS